MNNCGLLSREGLPQKRIQGSSADADAFKPGPDVDCSLLAKGIDDLHLRRLAGEMIFAPHQAGAHVQCIVSLFA